MSARLPRLVVVDASVALKWHLHDEDSTEQAYALLEACCRKQVNLSAPSLIEYEVANALRSAMLKHRLTLEEARAALIRQQRVEIKLYNFLPYSLASLDLSATAACSVYDASYAALANSLGADFITGDLRLVNKLMGHIPNVHWIGDINVTYLKS